MDHSYRRMRRKTDPWHFCVNCSGWPREHFVGCDMPPLRAPLCRECVARHMTGACTAGCATGFPHHHPAEAAGSRRRPGMRG